MFGSLKGSRNLNLGDHLLGLGTQAKTPGSPRGSLKFSLEHSLELWSFSSVFSAFFVNKKVWNNKC